MRPQRGPGARPRRGLRVLRQPRHELEGLGPLELRLPPLGVDHVDRTEHPHHQRPGPPRSELSSGTSAGSGLRRRLLDDQRGVRRRGARPPPPVRSRPCGQTDQPGHADPAVVTAARGRVRRPAAPMPTTTTPRRAAASERSSASSSSVTGDVRTTTTGSHVSWPATDRSRKVDGAPAWAMVDVSASASAVAAATSGRWRTSWRPDGSGSEVVPDHQHLQAVRQRRDGQRRGHERVLESGSTRTEPTASRSTYTS